MTDARQWLRASYAYALVSGVLLAYFLLAVPIQVTDCFLNMVALDRPFSDLMRDTFAERGYLRPGLWAGLKGVYDLSGGAYTPWYRGTHAAQVVALLVLFVGMLQPRTAAAAAVVPLAIAVLIGSQTFAWTVLEAYPINTFLTIVIACAAATNLAFARHRWWNDVIAVLLFAAAALTVESGLLVWVIFAGGYLIGLRGVSRRGILALNGLLAFYFVVRFAWLRAGLPTLMDREAGFGFTRYQGAELQAMFGDNPFGFYAYNVMSSALNVLFAEPRDGIWRLMHSVVTGTPDYVLMMQVASTALATALVCRYIWVRRRQWVARRFERGDHLVLLFLFVLAANAAMSYAYTKDVIMSPAGLFFASAVFVACHDLVARSPATRAVIVRSAVVLLVLSTTHAVRSVGIHVGLRAAAVELRQQWAYVDDFLARRNRQLTPRERALKVQLQDDAVRTSASIPVLRNEWFQFFGYCCP